MKIMIDTNELPPDLAAVLHLAHRARKLSQVWVELPSRHRMVEKLLEDLGKLESEPRNWPPPDEQLFAWRYPTVPEEINRNSLLVLAMGLEHLAHAQLLHAELRGEWTPSVMELDWPGSTPQDPEAPREALTFRRVGKLGSRWADVV